MEIDSPQVVALEQGCDGMEIDTPQAGALEQGCDGMEIDTSQAGALGTVGGNRHTSSRGL